MDGVRLLRMRGSGRSLSGKMGAGGASGGTQDQRRAGEEGDDQQQQNGSQVAHRKHTRQRELNPEREYRDKHHKQQQKTAKRPAANGFHRHVPPSEVDSAGNKPASYESSGRTIMLFCREPARGRFGPMRLIPG